MFPKFFHRRVPAPPHETQGEQENYELKWRNGDHFTLYHLLSHMADEARYHD